MKGGREAAHLAHVARMDDLTTYLRLGRLPRQCPTRIAPSYSLMLLVLLMLLMVLRTGEIRTWRQWWRPGSQTSRRWIQVDVPTTVLGHVCIDAPPTQRMITFGKRGSNRRCIASQTPVRVRPYPGSACRSRLGLVLLDRGVISQRCDPVEDWIFLSLLLCGRGQRGGDR